MEYLDKEKLKLHLELGREIYQFTEIGQYFESKTFEYVSLAKSETSYVVKLVRVLDCTYSLLPSMDEFETVEKLESGCESIHTGSLADCLSWAKQLYKCGHEKWQLDLIEIYNVFVSKGILGQGSDHL